MNRRTAREIAVQVLFQHDFNEMDSVEMIEELLEPKERNQFVIEIVHGVKENIVEIDNLINEHLVNWTIDRIATVEKTVLRIATFELKMMQDAPPRVIINEAIELAKKFADEKSGKFVNGVLAKIEKNK